MTVFYSEEDSSTAELLAFFQQQTVPRVTWNWQPLHKYELFRRSIGRNKAALASQADWVWFTDCDLLFNQHCLDSLTKRLQGSKEVLVFPKEERTTILLAADAPLLTEAENVVAIRGINQDQFESHQRTRATGPLQITHGDVARACGYCDAIAEFQKPARHWCKAHEDRVFRWLLGTQGVGVSVPGVYRIRHIEKGRYKTDTVLSSVRRNIRRLQSLLRGE